MADDFMVCVDSIIASSATWFDRDSASATDSSRNGGQVEEKGGGMKDEKINGFSSSSLKQVMVVRKEMVECRICQEEDEVHAMESPCACNGTLKFAHRKCIQKWCNKKGDITCEICNQVFSPNYSLPPARSNPDVLAIDIRQAWGSHMNIRDSHLLAIAAAEGQFLDSDYEDYAAANTSSVACLRSVALILLILWLLRQILMVTREPEIVHESSSFFNYQVSLLQFAGFLLPCYVMARSWYLLQTRRRRQVTKFNDLVNETSGKGLLGQN